MQPALEFLRRALRVAIRAVRIAFVLVLVALPIPLPAFVASLIRGERKRAEVTQVERKS